MATRWNYRGDINLAHGGYFWKEDGQDDYVLCVDITPCSAAGGPDNVYHIGVGIIYLPTDKAKRKSALDCCGWLQVEPDGTPLDRDGRPLPSRVARAALVDAFKAYHGVEVDEVNIVRIGPKDPDAYGWCADNEPDFVLRSDAKLENFVRRELLHR